jgi:predicted nucleic acid-binding protein
MDLWVVDCSAFVPLVLVDEGADAIEGLLLRAARGQARVMVPVLFWYELSNVLRMAAKRKRISDADAEGGLFRCTGLPIETDAEMSPAVVLRIGRFAAEHQLTAYDAAYFELADRHSAKLLTADKGLLRLQKSHAWIQGPMSK